MNIKSLISNIVTEAALDSRIPDGIVNLDNIDHIQVVAERIYDTVLDEDIVNEFLSFILNEGKHPERQAFNKDGWLVTFPSKEYRDAAIKKGTHSISDPTHGKGGMNLYYKKKGKQKRQTQQATTQVTTGADVQKQAPAAPPVRPPVPNSTQQKAAAEKTKKTTSSLVGPEELGDEDSTAQPTSEPASAIKPLPSEKPAPAGAPAPAAPDAPEVPKPKEAPVIDVPVVEKQPEQYASISKKFAAKKGWMSEPYGEYRDREGNTVAVVGLSGEVVPIKSVDRDEYKLFAEKSMV